MSTRNHFVPRAISAATLLSVAIANCMAQTTPTEPAPASPANKSDAENAQRVEMVTVTARRREERIQDVPASVSAISAGQIEREGAVTFKDLGFSLGNYTSNAAYGNAARNEPIIRGIADNSAGGAGGTTAVYVDDVYIGDAAGFATSLLDVERFELLRGPQGTLFGKNAIAGAVNITTFRPGKTLEGSAALTVGNYGLVQPNFFVSGPLKANVLYGKLAATATSRRGFDRVDGTGERVNDQKNHAVRGGLLLTPTPDIDVALNFDLSRDDVKGSYADAWRDRAGQPYASANAPDSPPFGLPFPYFIQSYQGTAAAADGNVFDGKIPGNTPGQPNRALLDVKGVSLKAERRWSNLTLLSVTAARQYDQNGTLDGDNGVRDIFYDTSKTRYKQVSQEFRLVGESGPLRYVAGAFFFQGRKSSSTITRLGSDFLVDVSAVGVPIPPSTAYARLRDLVPDYGLVSDPLLNYQLDEKKSTSTALYGSVTYKVSDRLSATGGVRLNREKLEQVFTPSYPIFPALGLVDVPAPTRFSKTENDVSPTLSAVYKLSEEINVYGSFSRGFRSGFVNTSDSKVVKPEAMNNFELGLKSTLFDGRVSANLTAFRMNYADIQRSRIIATSPTIVVATDNASKSRIQGLELDLKMRATSALNLLLSVGLLDAKYIDYQGARVTLDDASTAVVNLGGTRMEFAPKATFALGANYDFVIQGDWRVQLGGQLQYRSAYQTGAGPATIFQVRNQTQGNAYLTFGKTNSDWTATLRVRNLGNKRYVVGPNQSPDGSDYAVLSEPRTITLEIKKTF
jgi:iron complex outermembrane recepter protein